MLLTHLLTFHSSRGKGTNEVSEREGAPPRAPRVEEEVRLVTFYSPLYPHAIRSLRLSSLVPRSLHTGMRIDRKKGA